MTNLLFFALSFLSCLLGVIIGRMSKQNDVNRELRDIEVEGKPLNSLEDVRRVISRLVSDKDGLITDNNQLRNSNNVYQKNIENFKDDYYKAMSQLREKRDELSKMQDQFDSVSEEKCRYYHKLQNNKNNFEEFVSNVEDKACGIGRATDSVYESLSDFVPQLNRLSIGIYVTKLKNKTKLLSIGFINIADNGKIIYPDVSRSLGLLTSNENKWAQRLPIPHDMEIGEPCLICAIYPNDITKRLGDLQTEIYDINGVVQNMITHINDNKNLLII